MKRIVLLQILSLAFISAFAQTTDPNISFKELEFDFGNIKEVDGSVMHRFEFSNIGYQPAIISNVKASCGCTTPKWTKEPVLPGTIGYIDVSYNPARRPGPFNKSITVTSNSIQNVIVLRIKGNVEGKPKTVEDEYRYSSGDIRLKSNHLNFGNLAVGKIGEKSIELINTGTTPAKVTFTDIPKHITITPVPENLPPGGKGEWKIKYNSDLVEDWDFVIHRVYANVNGESNEGNRISISATITEDFSNLTPEELEKAPKVAFDNNTFSFGNIKQGESASHEYIITNKGKSDLIIRKVKASCGCTAAIPDKNIIPPGESTNIKTTFNSRGKSGNIRKNITIITNDPINSKSVLWVKGQIITE